MAEIDPRDTLLQAHVPTVMVPRFSELSPLDQSGHRYLVAQDGLWIEVRRPWLHLVWPIAPSSAPLPYGLLKTVMDFAFDWDAFWALVEQFTREAFRALPNEHAAWFVWDERAQALKYFPLVGVASPARIELIRANLMPHEHLAVDIHSHGTFAADFSAIDDADDAGEVKLSVVLGKLDNPSAGGTDAQRLCAHGLFIPFDEPVEQACRVCGCTDSTPCEGGCAWVEPDLCSACSFNKD